MSNPSHVLLTTFPVPLLTVFWLFKSRATTPGRDAIYQRHTFARGAPDGLRVRSNNSLLATAVSEARRLASSIPPFVAPPISSMWHVSPPGLHDVHLKNRALLSSLERQPLRLQLLVTSQDHQSVRSSASASEPPTKLNSYSTIGRLSSRYHAER